MRLLSLVGTGAALLAAVSLSACSASPTGPSGVGAASQPTAVSSTLDGSGQFGIQSAHLSPDDFAARGWECRPSPVPGRRVCSRPNQGFPPVPPTDDRPTSFTLLVWENGEFAGTLLLLRPEVYNGQSCESTDAPYIFRPVIGYYECLHTVGN